jgi:hypothetical protein
MAHMKKLAIGCGIVAVVLLIGAAVATYFVVNKVRDTVAEFASLGEIPAIERRVTNQAAYTPPETGELTGAQVTRFVQVQQQVRSVLGARFDEFNTKYAALSERMNRDEGTPLDAPAVINAYRDLARTYVDAKKAQVDALNAAGFSLDEYRWVRGQAYAAIGMPVMDFDIAKVVENVKSGNTDDVHGTIGGSIGPSGPESNKALVEPHKKALEDNAALTFFGL